MHATVRTMLVCVCFLAFDVGAETRYISDVLHVPLRSGPSSEHRILHWGLRSGTALEVLGEDESAKFTQVRTGDGTEGWVPSQYLVNEPIAQDRLEAAEAQIERLEGMVGDDVSTLAAQLEQARKEAASNAEAAATILGLESELAQVRHVSASAIATQQENVELAETNAELRRALDDLRAQAEQREGRFELGWMLAGGGLVLVGFLIGAWVASRSRRRSSW